MCRSSRLGSQMCWRAVVACLFRLMRWRLYKFDQLGCNATQRYIGRLRGGLRLHGCQALQRCADGPMLVVFSDRRLPGDLRDCASGRTARTQRAAEQPWPFGFAVTKEPARPGGARLRRSAVRWRSGYVAQQLVQFGTVVPASSDGHNISLKCPPAECIRYSCGPRLMQRRRRRGHPTRFACTGALRAARPA